MSEMDCEKLIKDFVFSALRYECKKKGKASVDMLLTPRKLGCTQKNIKGVQVDKR